ncbi:hypothetical protein D3C86_1582160 [compost metagenome]
MIDTFSAANTYGTANGMRICQYWRAVVARSERDSSTSSAGTDASPSAVDTTSGKKAIIVVMTTRGSTPAPSVTTMIGATATIGVDWITTSHGMTMRDSSGERVMATASGSARQIATT